jgi:hypothetical protein
MKRHNRAPRYVTSAGRASTEMTMSGRRAGTRSGGPRGAERCRPDRGDPDQLFVDEFVEA